MTKEQHISPKPGSGSGIKFSNDSIFGTLSVSLPSIAVDFNGDLLSLVALDIEASKVNAPVNLEPAWLKLLSAGKITCFIVDCCHGYEIFGSAEAEPLIGDLEQRVATSLQRNSYQPCRARLGELLLDVSAKLNRDIEEEMRAMLEGFSNSNNTMSVQFEDTTTNEVARHYSSNSRSEEGVKNRDLLEMVRQALDVVNNGPTPNFRIDLYLSARGLVSSKRLPERHDSAVMGSGFFPELWRPRSGTGLDRGAPCDSDSNDIWDHGRHYDSYEGFYGDDEYDSQET